MIIIMKKRRKKCLRIFRRHFIDYPSWIPLFPEDSSEEEEELFCSQGGFHSGTCEEPEEDSEEDSEDVAEEDSEEDSDEDSEEDSEEKGGFSFSSGTEEDSSGGIYVLSPFVDWLP